MTLSALPVPAIGPSLKAFTVTGMTEATTGVLTAGTSYNILANVEEYDWQNEPAMTDATPMSSGQTHNVRYRDNVRMTINEIMQDQSTITGGLAVPSALDALVQAYAIVQVSWNFAGTVKTFTGSIGESGYTGHAEKNVFRLVLHHYALTSNNPTSVGQP